MATLPKTKYEDNNGNVYSIRLTAPSLAVAGAPPTGGVNRDIKCKITKSSREFGLRPRFLTLGRVIGTAPNDSIVYAKVPILTLAEFNDPANSLEATKSYDGETWTIVSKTNEDFN